MRTLRLVRGILDYAKVQGWRIGDNPAAWKGNIEHALPTLATDKHHPALPFSEIYEFMTKLRAEPGVAARALEFLILTAARTGEVREARWSEIDLAAKVWTVPGERTKTGKEHRVPLSPRALELLKAAPREIYSDLVFIGVQKDKPLGHSSMNEALKRLRPNITAHGFRSTFRDWAAENYVIVPPSQGLAGPISCYGFQNGRYALYCFGEGDDAHNIIAVAGRGAIWRSGSLSCSRKSGSTRHHVGDQTR